MNQGFKAGLFHPDFGNEVIEGRVVIGRWSVQFYSDTINEEIPIDQVEIDAQTEEARISFYDTSRPELKIFTSDRSLLKHPSFLQNNPLRHQVRAKAGRLDASRAVRVTGYFLGGCLLVYLLGSMAMSMAVRSLANQVPVEWEQKSGRAMVDQLRREHMLVTDPEKIAQLAALAEPLVNVVPELKGKAKFYIVESDELNAFALPGGYILIHTPLLEMTETPEELLGVLAHEIAHVTQKHIEREMIASAGPMLVFGVLLHSGSGLGEMMGAGSALVVIQGFSQDYEIEADDKGWEYMVAAGINPQGMITMFRKMKAYEDQERAQYSDGMEMPQALSTHPKTEKRIARLESRWNRLSRKKTFEPLTNAIPKIESGNPGATSERPRGRKQR